MPTQQLSESEVAHMRKILAQHDSEHKPMRVFDLNSPPREQYRFQKFPMMVYDLANSNPSYEEDQPRRNGMGIETVHVPARVISRTVNSEEELQEAIAQGWSEQAPAYSEDRAEPLSSKYASEAGRVDAQIEEQRVKRGPGRPKQVA